MSGDPYSQPGPYASGILPSPHFYPNTEATTVSPIDGPSRYLDQYRSSGGLGNPSQPGQLATLALHHSKRPYRQRRKDPSCDACRERKVKACDFSLQCDATETTSCTECSSRNVRCQFTKDTNRRMSSIKQVQDLERQLLDTKQQLERYRTGEHRGDASSALSRSPSESLSDLPTHGKSPRRMLKAKTPQDLSNARSEMSNYGRGLLKPPVIASLDSVVDHISLHEQDLPSRQTADSLLEIYLQCVHRHFPVMHWLDFRQTFANIYAKRNETVTVDKDSIGLLFAVFACAMAFSNEPDWEQQSEGFVERAMAAVKMWEEDLTTTQAIIAFLVSIYLFERNRRSASWVWVACAIRAVQDKGFHVQGGQWSSAEGEMRKRIWYSFYVWDRVVSLELGKPMLIDDDECDTEYPDSLEEELGGSEDNLGPLQPTLLLAAVHIARLMSPLSKLFRSLCITTQTLHKFEAHLYSCLYLLPRPLQLSTQSILDPLLLRPIIYFQNTRLLLHRHNISPACSGDQRSQAISQCIFTAQDTATTLSRTMTGVSQEDWQKRMGQAANGVIATHIWRCMLFLISRHLYEPFFVLVQVASTIGDKRLVNICCGRYLLFFIERLIDRAERGKINDLEQDEELLAYLSGDLQAGASGWVWGNAETGTLLSRRQKHGRSRFPSNDSETESSFADAPSIWNATLTDEERQRWGGWQRVEHAAKHLRGIIERAAPQLLSQQSIQLPAILQRTESSDASSTPPPDRTSPSETSRSRMNIASII